LSWQEEAVQKKHGLFLLYILLDRKAFLINRFFAYDRWHSPCFNPGGKFSDTSRRESDDTVYL